MLKSVKSSWKMKLSHSLQRVERSPESEIEGIHSDPRALLKLGDKQEVILTHV